MADERSSAKGKPGKILIFALAVLGVVFFAGLAAILHYTSTDYAMSLIGDSNPQKRRWGVDQLVLKGLRSGKPALELAMDEKANPESRRLAIFILGEIHYRDATPQLLGFFKGDNLVFSEQAAYALGRLGDVSIVGELTGRYENAPKGLKLKIISALAELGTPEGMRVIQAEADKNEEGTLRDAAKFALQKPQTTTGDPVVRP